MNNSRLTYDVTKSMEGGSHFYIIGVIITEAYIYMQPE